MPVHESMAHLNGRIIPHSVPSSLTDLNHLPHMVCQYDRG